MSFKSWLLGQQKIIQKNKGIQLNAGAPNTGSLPNQYQGYTGQQAQTASAWSSGTTMAGPAMPSVYQMKEVCDIINKMAESKQELIYHLKDEDEDVRELTKSVSNLLKTWREDDADES